MMTLTPDPPTQEDLNITLLETFEINLEDFPSTHERRSSICKEEDNSVDTPELYCFEDYHPLATEVSSSSPVNDKENIFSGPTDDK